MGQGQKYQGVIVMWKLACVKVEETFVQKFLENPVYGERFLLLLHFAAGNTTPTVPHDHSQLLACVRGALKARQ